MRLWHIDIIPYLPKSQLLGLWRELNSIFKKQDKHILIKYIYDYPKEYLCYYSCAVIMEMKKRNITIRNQENFFNYFKETSLKDIKYELIYKEHNFEYLEICVYNLKEKYLRGQKDFDTNLYLKLLYFFETERSKQNAKKNK